MSRQRFIGLAWAVALAGCTVAPRPPASTLGPSPEPPSVAPATPGPPIETPAPTASWVTGTVDPSYTTLLEEFRSTGTYVIWSTTARASGLAAPDLYGLQPGGNPKLLYDNPNRDTSLSPIAGDGSRFAFIESKPVGMIAGPWKLWYLAAPGAHPFLVDHGSGQPPFIAISDRYLVWTIGQGDTVTSYLKLLDLATMESRVIEREPPQVAVFGRPDLDGSRLVYAVYGDGSHIYYRDLASDTPAIRIDASWCASQAAIHGDDVVWSECAANGQEGGRLIHYSLATSALSPLAMPTVGDLGFLQPSVGIRYVAAWPFTDRMLYLADLQTGTYPAVLDLGLTSDDAHDAVGQPDLKGDLLAYAYWSVSGETQLRWVVLR